MEQSSGLTSRRDSTDTIGTFLKLFIFAFVSLLATKIEQYLHIGDLHPVAYNVLNSMLCVALGGLY